MGKVDTAGDIRLGIQSQVAVSRSECPLCRQNMGISPGCLECQEQGPQGLQSIPAGRDHPGSELCKIPGAEFALTQG